MTGFVVRRLARLVAVLAAVTLGTFAFTHLVPGDPVALRLGDHATHQQIEALRRSFGLDRPWYEQLGLYVVRLLHGDLGNSIADDEPVLEKLAQYFPATLELTFGALVFALVAGIPAGIFAALRRRTIVDVVTMSVVLLGVSIPVFWLGFMLVYLLAVLPSYAGLDLFPISGRISLHYVVPVRTHLVIVDALLAGKGAAALDALRHLVLPSITLGTIPLAIVAKITRSGMLEVLGSDYVRTARAKGLAPVTVVVRHALRNALLPILTVVGLQTGLLLGGAVLTEHVFAWPGVGRLAFDAISRRDLPLINGCILLFAGVFVTVNALVDVLYAAANPRVRYGG